MKKVFAMWTTCSLASLALPGMSGFVTARIRASVPTLASVQHQTTRRSPATMGDTG
jgi:NADH:ubiquinone oxidoreductase subunit 4 (subunit M)